MAKATTGKLIDQSHPDYDDIFERWKEEGCPDQFDRAGTFGGAIYDVHQADDQVNFFQRHSLGPTTIDEETGQVIKGWEFINEKGMRIEGGREGQPGKLRYIDAPNEL